MTKSTITRERLEELAAGQSGFNLRIATHEESQELACMALSAMDSEPVVWLNGCNKSVPAALRYLAENPKPIGGESSFNTAHLYQLAREIELMAEGTLYRHAQPAPVVDADDNFYSWFGREWQENYQHNQYTTAAKQMLGVMAESAWKAGRRAAMLQDEPVTTANKLGNSPVIPDGLIAAVNRLLDSDGSRGCYSAIQCGDAHDEIERLLAAAPQEVKP